MKKMIFPRFLPVGICAVVLALSLVLFPVNQADAIDGGDDEGKFLYLAAEGDILSEIAAVYAVDTELIAAINNLDPNEILPAGAAVWIPEETMAEIIVKPGDTLWSLARSHGTTVAELMAQNSLSSTIIYSGQALSYLATEEELDPGMLDQRTEVLASRQDVVEFIWPLQGIITSAYGQRSRGWHSGLDIAAESGTPIACAADGVVIEAGWKNSGYGNAVMVEHADGCVTLYGHASEVLVLEGDRVRQGDAIALVGSTGNSTGPHLHFEVRIDGNCDNPISYLPENSND